MVNGACWSSLIWLQVKNVISSFNVWLKVSGPKMLSKELNKLELNGLITRSVQETKPVTVEYELTEYARSLKPLIDEMGAWGKQHRQKIFKNEIPKI